MPFRKPPAFAERFAGRRATCVAIAPRHPLLRSSEGDELNQKPILNLEEG